jgi:glycosyltransferase involved in cell wall biosynthesis
MERARPVIASAVGGLDDLVEDGETGLLVAPGEVSPLADAIAALAADPPRAAAMGQAARRRALAEFPHDRCVDRIDALYRSLLDGATAAPGPRC